MPRLTAMNVASLETLRRMYRGELPGTWREQADALAEEIAAKYPHVVEGQRLLAETISAYAEDADARSDERILREELPLLDAHLDALCQNQGRTLEEIVTVIAWVRLAKEQSIDFQDFERAASMRDREKRALSLEMDSKAGH